MMAVALVFAETAVGMIDVDDPQAGKPVDAQFGIDHRPVIGPFATGSCGVVIGLGVTAGILEIVLVAPDTACTGVVDL